MALWHAGISLPGRIISVARRALDNVERLSETFHWRAPQSFKSGFGPLGVWPNILWRRSGDRPYRRICIAINTEPLSPREPIALPQCPNITRTAHIRCVKPGVLTEFKGACSDPRLPMMTTKFPDRPDTQRHGRRESLFVDLLIGLQAAKKRNSRQTMLRLLTWQRLCLTAVSPILQAVGSPNRLRN